MKKKKIKKLSDMLWSHIQNRYEANVSEKTENNYKWCDYDPEVSDKFKTMFISLLNYKNNLRFEASNDRISIFSDNVSTIKTPKNNTLSKSSIKYDESKSLRIEVYRSGFNIQQGYDKSIYYKDPNMYLDIIDDVKSIIIKVNNENFNSVWEEIMIESGVVRDNNLEKLLQ